MQSLLQAAQISLSQRVQILLSNGNDLSILDCAWLPLTGLEQCAVGMTFENRVQISWALALILGHGGWGAAFLKVFLLVLKVIVIPSWNTLPNSILCPRLMRSEQAPVILPYGIIHRVLV